MPVTPSMSPVARPTSAMRNGCSAFTPVACCAPASVRSGEIVELRAYLRQRERLLDTAASHIQHMQKAMTEMNLQLHHVVSDITGATGMRIIRAIIAGERDPAVLASMRDTRCHSSAEVIEKALTGHYRGEHLFVLEQALALYDVYQHKVAACDIRIEAVLKELSSIRGRTKGAHGAIASGPPPKRQEPPVERLGLRCRGGAPFLARQRLDQDPWHWPLSRAQARVGMQRRFLGMAERQALHLVAVSGARQQDIGGQGAVVAHPTIREPRRIAPASRRRDHWPDRHGAGSLLPAIVDARRQGQGRHRDGEENCGAVLQRAAPRHGLRRSGRFLLRDPLPGAGHRKSPTARQGLRIRIASRRGAGRRACRFLGKRAGLAQSARGRLGRRRDDRQPPALLRKLHPPANFRRGVEAHKRAGGSAAAGVRARVTWPDKPSVQARFSKDFARSTFSRRTGGRWPRRFGSPGCFPRNTKSGEGNTPACSARSVPWPTRRSGQAGNRGEAAEAAGCGAPA